MTPEPGLPPWTGLIMLPLCVYLGWAIVEAIRSGVARVKRGEFQRHQHPVLYGVTLVLQTFMFIVFSGLMLALLMGRI